MLVHREQHLADRPRRRRAGRRARALGRAGAAADQRRHPGRDRLVDDLRADEVHVPVDPARGQDPPLAGDDLGRRPDLADRGARRPSRRGCRPCPAPTMRPVADADVALDDAPVIEHDDVRDHGVRRALRRRAGALQHRLADRLAAAEDGLVAADAAVLLDLEPEIGVGQSQPVADRRPVERAVALARRSSSQPRHRARAAERHQRRRRVRLPARSAPTSPPACRAGSRRAAARSNDSASLTCAKWKCDPTWIGRSPVFITRSDARLAPRVELDLARGA